jgi:hypothetical protein
MSVLSSAIRNLSASLKQVGGEAVSYRRGNDSVEFVAVPVRTSPHDYSIEADVSLTALDRDFIVWADDLAIGGELTLPMTGDEIDWFDSQGNKHTYQVVQRAGERCYRYTDQTQLQLRVFTVEAIASTE